MGCGESKHVATGNTISRKASRAGSGRGKTSETIEETSKNGSKTSSIMKKEEGKNVSQDSGGGNSRAAADVKDIAESTELKKEENVENEETVEGIAFEGISERSEYYSPQEEAAKESLSNETVKVADALEDKKLAQETKEETVNDQKLAEEKKEETAKGEPETMKEKNLVKETETAETTEAKVSTPVENKAKESAVSPAAEDLKTE